VYEYARLPALFAMHDIAGRAKLRTHGCHVRLAGADPGFHFVLGDEAGNVPAACTGGEGADQESQGSAGASHVSTCRTVGPEPVRPVGTIWCAASLRLYIRRGASLPHPRRRRFSPLTASTFISTVVKARASGHRGRELSLLAFPLIQAAAFAGACAALGGSPWLAGLFILISALFLSFSLHITYHYHVHFKRRSKTVNRGVDLAITALLGMPFHYYQMLHWNHHKYDNAIGDFTSTWKLVAGQPVPKRFLPYALFWPFSGNVRSRDQLRIAEAEGYFKPWHRRALRQEVLLLLAVYGTLLWLGPAFAVAYAVTVYVGWCLVTMHNYGQHLPERYGEVPGNSYYNPLYNKLTIYNGLHNEHHARPGLRYWDLSGPSAGEIRHPHILAGFFFALGRRSANRREQERRRVEPG
jgi:fatty acid desaturase